MEPIVKDDKKEFCLHLMSQGMFLLTNTKQRENLQYWKMLIKCVETPFLALSTNKFFDFYQNYQIGILLFLCIVSLSYCKIYCAIYNM